MVTSCYTIQTRLKEDNLAGQMSSERTSWGTSAGSDTRLEIKPVNSDLRADAQSETCLARCRDLEGT